jgi:hypothetical protein
LSALGYLVTGATMALITFATPGFGHDVAIWDRVGDQVRAGASPYGMGFDPNLVFLYSPPWALLFAGTSWLPYEVQVGGLIILEVLAWRICAGSWRRVGYWGLFPIFGFELAVGQRWAVLAAFAKLSPALAIRELRRPLIVALGAVLATMPVFWLWTQWFNQLFAASDIVAAPVPYWIRLAVAVALLLTRRTWARGLAVIVAIPNPTANVYVLLAALTPALRARNRTTSS